MDDDDFEPRLGRIRAAGSRSAKRYLHAVIGAARRAGSAGPRARTRRFDGSRIGRGAVAGRLLGRRDRLAQLRTRRAVVKARIVRLGGKGYAAARAHLRYIQRDAATGGEREGRLYSASDDRADGTDFLKRGEGDRHQFRFIVSAEDGAQYDDLRPLVRRLMKRMEEDLGTGLDWVAADHRDTLHPHSHIMLRGRDDSGANLVIAPEYISRGMRERVAELIALDLGPRSDREIEDRLRRDIGEERLTATDRRLLQRAGLARIADASGSDRADQAILTGRLAKLERLGLAASLGGGRWQLADGLEASLRALGERGDIIRTMQRAFAARGQERPGPALRLYDPAEHGDLVGRLVARGLSDELRDRHYLIVDACDGNAYHVRAGEAGAVEALPEGAIVRVVPASGGIRPVDLTITEIAAAHGGRYSAALHAEHDPNASREFVAAHERRLEAVRRSEGIVREPDGTWRIGPDYLDRVAAYEVRQRAARPVAVELLSPLAPEQLARRTAATWLDEQLTSDAPVPLRGAGFGAELRTALAVRRGWLLATGIAQEREGALEFAPDALARLRRAERNRTVAALARALGKESSEVGTGSAVTGVVRRRIDLAAGRFALIEGERSFALVPWRPVLARALGREVSGVAGPRGVSWTIGRVHGLER